MQKFERQILVIIILFLSACQQKCETEKLTSIICLIDETDTINTNNALFYLSKEGEVNKSIFANQLLNSFFKFENCAGGSFKLGKLNAVGENSTIKLKYPEKSTSFSSDQTQFQINNDPGTKKFKHELDNLAQYIQPKKSSQKSKIYLPITTALNELKESNSTRKILIVFSDMIENSEPFSFYKSKKEIDAIDILSKLEEHYNTSFPSLNDIEIFIINKRIEKNDLLIDKAKIFWSKVFLDEFKAKKFYFGSSLDLN